MAAAVMLDWLRRTREDGHRGCRGGRTPTSGFIASESADAKTGVGAGVNSGESFAKRRANGNLSQSSALRPQASALALAWT
jgi:hypothetical protein